MTAKQKTYWTFFAATAVVYAALFYVAEIKLKQMSGGLQAFDFRIGGYSHADAQEFLYALTPGGTEHYLNVVQAIDTLFPAMLTAVLSIGIYHLSGQLNRYRRLVLSAAPLAYIGFDFWENELISQMLQFNGEELPIALVSAASDATIMKFVTLGVSVMIVLTLFALRWKNRDV
jgi:hypothetical protein